MGRYSFKPPDVASGPLFKCFNAKARRRKAAKKIPKEIHFQATSRNPTATRLHQSAQRCRDEGVATLGNEIKPEWVESNSRRDDDATLSGLELFWTVDPR